MCIYIYEFIIYYIYTYLKKTVNGWVFWGEGWGRFKSIYESQGRMIYIARAEKEQ